LVFVTSRGFALALPLTGLECGLFFFLRLIMYARLLEWARMQSYHSVTWVSASLLLVWTTVDDYIRGMCGRVIQSSGPLRYAIVDGMNVRDSRVHNYPARWNAAPSQDLLIIRDREIQSHNRCARRRKAVLTYATRR
jgi:hypothetical protein